MHGCSQAELQRAHWLMLWELLERMTLQPNLCETSLYALPKHILMRKCLATLVLIFSGIISLLQDLIIDEHLTSLYSLEPFPLFLSEIAAFHFLQQLYVTII